MKNRLTRFGAFVLTLPLILGFAVARSPVAVGLTGLPQRRTVPHTSKDPVVALTGADIANGEKLFVGHCAYCHGIGGTGERGPNLARPVLKRAPDNQALFKLIQNGIDGSEMPGSWQLSDHETWQVAGYVRSLGRNRLVAIPGDPKKGQALYETKGCPSCHIVRGLGGILGPDLTDVGLRRSAAFLRDALNKPGATAPEGFLMIRVRTKDGQEVEGVRLNEDSFTVQLQDISGGFRSFRKADLAVFEKEFDKSPMPSYGVNLNQSEMTDLIAYLASLRGHE